MPFTNDSSLGPLGNQSVRVEDFVEITNAASSVGASGTLAVLSVSVISASASFRTGSYWSFTGPQPRDDKPDTPVRHFHVWYEVDGSGVDPLPASTNQIGIKVVLSALDASNVVASATASSINAYFAGPNGAPAIASATATDEVIALTILEPGPARIKDGVGSTASGLAASATRATNFGVASTTPGVHVNRVAFEVASVLQASGATAASAFSLKARHTGSTFSVAADAERTTLTMPASVLGNLVASAAAADYFQLRTPDNQYYVWFTASNGAGGVSTDPSGSGTGVAVNGLLGSTAGTQAASIALLVASALNAVGSSAVFSVTTSAADVIITGASVGSVTVFASSGAAASVVSGSVVAAQTVAGGAEWTVTRSNRIEDPNVTLEADSS
ncbi:MAG: hypothetical protein ACXABY_18790 [Candidatus Thorarchaeota archaeon]|jgi:hypothetical protein